MPAEPALPIGSTIGGKYELRRVLGIGGMGAVYLAENRDIGRMVAIKVLHPQLGRDPGVVQRFRQEARAASSIGHPGVVDVLDLGEAADGSLFIVMERLEGQTVGQRLQQRGKLDATEVVAIMADVADVIGAAHTRGIVHRDLKPENLFLVWNPRWCVKVLDFGISRFTDCEDIRITTNAAVMGTVLYMAPEQARDARVAGPPADLYSLGAVLYHALAGRPPFLGSNYNEVLSRVLTEAAEPLLTVQPDVPSALAEVVMSLLSKTPEARPATAEDVRDALLAAIPERAMPSEPAILADTVPPIRAKRGEETATSLAVDSQPFRISTRLHFAVRTIDCEDWVAPVTERLLQRHLRSQQDRRYYLADNGQLIDITCRYASEGFRLDALSDRRILASITGSSLIESVRGIIQAIDALAVGLPFLPADPEELAEIARLDAHSPTAYRRYRDVLERYLGTSYSDSRRLAAALEVTIAEDPEWPRAYVLLLLLCGIHGPDATTALDTARERCSRDRDPNGWRLLDAIELFRRNQLQATHRELSTLFREEPTDPLIGVLLLRFAIVAQELDDVSAVARTCQNHHPDLCFGFDVAEYFYRTGRPRDAECAIREYAAARPENVSVVVELVRIEAAVLRTVEASGHAARLLSIYGDQSEHLSDLFEAMIASDNLSQARRMAERMLLGTSVEQARGRYRMAVIAVFEGKFAAAHNSLRKAIEINRPLATESELSQCLELGRSIARVVGDLATHRRLSAELAEAYANLVGDPTAAAIVRHQLALLDERPAIDPHVAMLDGASQDLARTRMQRNSALADPALARSVVDTGFAGNEDDPASLLALGICARREGELAIARKSFEAARRLWSSALSNLASPYHALLAQYYLASTLADLGEGAQARAHYEAFIRTWGDADRPIAEVALARQALLAL